MVSLPIQRLDDKKIRFYITHAPASSPSAADETREGSGMRSVPAEGGPRLVQERIGLPSTLNGSRAIEGQEMKLVCARRTNLRFGDHAVWKSDVEDALVAKIIRT